MKSFKQSQGTPSTFLFFASLREILFRVLSYSDAWEETFLGRINGITQGKNFDVEARREAKGFRFAMSGFRFRSVRSIPRPVNEEAGNPFRPPSDPPLDNAEPRIDR